MQVDADPDRQLEPAAGVGLVAATCGFAQPPPRTGQRPVEASVGVEQAGEGQAPVAVEAHQQVAPWTGSSAAAVRVISAGFGLVPRANLKVRSGHLLVGRSTLKRVGGGTSMNREWRVKPWPPT